jgi:uncharacterized protein
VKTFITVCLFAFSCFAGFKTYQENVINIEGNASIKVIPDMAIFVIGASSVSNNVDSAIASCKTATAKLSDFFEKFKISKADIKSNRLSISENYEWGDDGKRKKVGFKVIKTYKITYRNLKTIEEFLLEASSYGSNEFDDIKFEHSKIDSLKRTVITAAIDDAYFLASKVANKTGVKLGKPIVISNVEPKSFSYDNIFDIGSISAPDFLKGGSVEKAKVTKEALKELFTISPGTIEIKNTVYITFSINK